MTRTLSPHRAFLGGAVFIASLAMGSAVLQCAPEDAGACERCGWAPPDSTREVTVRPGMDIRNAIRTAPAGATILLEDGEYQLPGMLHITTEGLTLRGKSGDCSKVVLRGAGMTERTVGVALSVAAPGVTLADLTAGHVGYHGIQVRGELGVRDVSIHNVRVVDCGQQLLKGSVGKGKPYAEDCLVACSTFEYTESAPSTYTNGVDVIAGKGWTVRDSTFRRIRGPREKGWASGPAILFWGNSIESVIERNLLVDCYRGIALGLKPGASGRPRDGETRYDHQKGVVLQNVIVNLNSWADEGIEVNGCPDVRVEHNTVFVDGRLPWNLSLRFSSTSGIVRNNLLLKGVARRDGASGRLESNVHGAKKSWFLDPAAGDLRLAGKIRSVVDIARPVDGLDRDFDRKPRVHGGRADAGAFEFRGGP